jgi:sulfate adenylyltransferase
MLTAGEPVPEEFSRPEVLPILREYYAGLNEKVGIDLPGHVTGNFNGEKSR